MPTQFRSDGFNFRLVRRDGMVALLSKQKTQHDRPSFEVVVIQTRPAERIFGRELPEREAMPGSECWGRFGWSYGDRAGATARFNQLCLLRRKGHFPPKGSATTASKRSPTPSAPAKSKSPAP